MKKTDRERMLFLLEQAIKNAPVYIPEPEMTKMLRSINNMKRRSHEENIKELKKFLSKRYKKKTPKITAAAVLNRRKLFGRFSKGKS